MNYIELNDIDILMNGFKTFNINEQEYFEKKIKERNHEIDNTSKAYFDLLVSKTIKENINFKCNCDKNHYFVIGNYCTNGILHEICQIPNKYLKQNILYYSLKDFIELKPFIVT